MNMETHKVTYNSG